LPNIHELLLLNLIQLLEESDITKNPR